MRIVAVLAALLMLAACADPAQEPEPTAAPTPPADEAAEVTPTPTVPEEDPDGEEAPSAEPDEPRADVPEGWASCENAEEGYVAYHPQEWETNPGETMPECSLFDPQPIDDVEEGTDIPLDIAVAIYVDPVPFEDVTSDGVFLEEENRREATVDGHDAVRLESVATGGAIRPEGTRTVTWAVDLGDATLIASSNEIGEPAFDEKVRVLDQMMQTLQLEAHDH